MELRPPHLEMFFRANSYHNLCQKTVRRKTGQGRRHFLLPGGWLQAHSRASSLFRVMASRQNFQTPAERYLADRLHYWDWRFQEQMARG